MAKPAVSGLPQRVPLSKERVLAAAVELADRDGLDALSMRRLATDLGVEAMSVYYYVRNKNEVLSGILERAVSELEIPVTGTPWKQALRATALSAHAALDRHRWAAALLMTPDVPSATRVRWVESMLAALAAADLPPGLADHAYHALDSYIIGFTMWQSSIPTSAARLEDLARTFLATMSIDELPHTADHLRWHMARPGGGGARAFESGLDMFLDGLEARAADADRAAGREGRPRGPGEAGADRPFAGGLLPSILGITRAKVKDWAEPPRAADCLQNRLRLARAERGLSQGALGRAVGVSRQTISSIETGQYGPSTVLAFRLARALGEPAERLFWLEGETDAELPDP